MTRQRLLLGRNEFQQLIRERISIAPQIELDIKKIEHNYKVWDETNAQILLSYISDKDISTEYSRCIGMYTIDHDLPEQLQFKQRIGIKVTKLHSILERLQFIPEDDIKNNNREPEKDIENIAKKFNAIAKQLQRRYDSRETIKIKDEYDVQDLFHALLKLFFNDIRPEEYSPSYAGGNSRMDFILKDEKIAIEIKKTRSTLKEKQVGEQLIIDIERYKKHQDCKTLICFVYDPDQEIHNPYQLENDLTKESEGISVKVFVEPK